MKSVLYALHGPTPCSSHRLERLSACFAQELAPNAATHRSSERTGSVARDIKPAGTHFSIGVCLRLAVPDNSEAGCGYLGILGSDAADRLIESDF
jgi:hypothetical protein